MLSINFGNAEKLCEDFCLGMDRNGAHHQGVADWVYARVQKYLSNINLELAENANDRKKLDELKSTLSKYKVLAILCATHESHDKLSHDFQKFKNIKLTYRSKGKFLRANVLHCIFNYTAFRRYKENIYNGFTLSEQLNVACCPYCNRNYTTSHITSIATAGRNKGQMKRVFPEFDHFRPQNSHPILTLSFYNLIPSCSVCNTNYKNRSDSKNIFHPYIKSRPAFFRFKDRPNDVESLYGFGKTAKLDFEFNIENDISKQLAESLELFGIRELYERCHNDLIQEVIYKKIAFGERYLKELSRTYNLGFEDVYKMLFESHFDDNMLHMRPFSKIKKDLFKGNSLHYKPE